MQLHPTSTQIAIRLPDEMVEFIDRQVRDGKRKSRAAPTHLSC
jgi:Arc/MetJ-type ribon-helix-helix transcriptional regulator